MAQRTRQSPPIGVRELTRRTRELRRRIGAQLRAIREDASLTIAEVARAAGIDRAHLHRIEEGAARASLEVLAAVGAVLGADLSTRFYPGTAPRIHDRFQAPIVEALLRMVDSSWSSSPEVPVGNPTRGFIDLVFRRPDATVATEVQSELKRVEQVLRWSAEKATALGDASNAGTVSRLLVIRSTVETRAVARSFEATFAAAYPAPSSAAFDALTRPNQRWPGSAIIWASVHNGEAEILRFPPRGVRLGRQRE